MAILTQHIIDLLRDKKSIKALATVDRNGEVHLVYKGSITVTEDQTKIELTELLETSQTQKNLTGSIWFNKKVAINVLGKDGTSYEIKGIPERYIIAGPAFEARYKEIRTRDPESDLSGIWIINPVSVREETYSVRLREEKENYPIIGHLDRDLPDNRI